ncbi:uncharacterized protein DS421_16g551150 [Arachis hypogaea]|nr:uncharacterized protein DS421_16g551150 [Arachis hypogaea]
MAARNQAGKNQTKDLKCATHLLSEKFRNMSEEKKTIVRDLGFGGLMHIPPLRVHHQILRELANSFKLEENRLETSYGSFKVRPKTIGAALGINASDEMMDIGIGNEQDRLMFKRIFILYIQMAFLTQFKKKKVIVEDSSPEQAQSYHGYSTLEKEADLRSTEGHYVSSETVYFRLSLVEESASEPTNSNMMVVREETPSEGLAIVPIQVCLPLSQTTTEPKIEETPETENEPTPLLQIEGTTKTNPAPEDAAALMMMARTASYVPKTDPMPSFSLGFTDSSQEETATQEGASTQDEHRAKTPETPKLLEQLGDLIVSVMCFILNQQNIQRFQEEVYCLPPDIVNMALENHPQGIFLQPKNNKHFRVEDYPMFIPFLDLQKLKSHCYIFAPLCHSQHWWLWFADTRKRKFYIVDPYHTKSPSDERTALNTFVYMLGGTSEIKGQGQRNCSTIPSHLGPKDKWLEIFEPANIKRRKYEWDNWTQDEVDHSRVEYASRILFHDMNLDIAEAIRGSNAIRLSKSSSLLLSPYCQIDSEDVDTT